MESGARRKPKMGPLLTRTPEEAEGLGCGPPITVPARGVREHLLTCFYPPFASPNMLSAKVVEKLGQADQLAEASDPRA
jgi:hypothetical protein